MFMASLGPKKMEPKDSPFSSKLLTKVSKHFFVFFHSINPFHVHSIPFHSIPCPFHSIFNSIPNRINSIQFQFAGHREALKMLGAIYLDGIFAPMNEQLAFECFQKAANDNDDFSMFKLGQMYHFGEGISNDDTLALYWYEKATEQGWDCSEQIDTIKERLLQK